MVCALRQNDYRNYDDRIFQFPEELDRIQSHLRTVGGAQIEQDFTFAKLLQDITFTYSAMNSVLYKHDRRVLGFEVADIINNDDDFYARALPSNASIEAWRPLAQALDVVFGWDMGQMVELHLTPQRKPRCVAGLPAGHNILLVPIPVLRVLFERMQKRTDIRWDFTSDIFSCRSTANCNREECGLKRLQRIKTGTGKLQRTNGKIIIEEEVPAWLDDDGLVCFGCTE